MNYAGFWRRTGAYVIDTVLWNVAQIPVYLAFGFSIEAMYSLDPGAASMFDTVGGIVLYLALLILGVLYFVLMESSSRQATLGKMAVGLVVTDVQGNRISPLRAFGRYLAKFLSLMVFFIGFIMVAFTDRKQGLHDILCSTLVLKAKPGQTGVDVSVFD